jgi:hypothetical protein
MGGDELIMHSKQELSLAVKDGVVGSSRGLSETAREQNVVGVHPFAPSSS